MTATLTPVRLHASRINLPDVVRIEVISALGITLAASLDLYTQLKQAHWNVKGIQFFQLHELFDSLATDMIDVVDTVAERITALGGVAYGTARSAAKDSPLPEYPLEINSGSEHLHALIERFALYTAHLREGIEKTANIGDADTSDLYTELSRSADKHLWFLEAHIQA